MIFRSITRLRQGPADSSPQFSGDETRNLAVARRQALRITLIYLVVGSLWILLSDKFVETLFSQSARIIQVSMFKGWFYVLATSVLIYLLIYPALSRTLIANEKLKNLNSELAQSNQLYIGLCQENEEKQVLLKALLDSIPDLIFYKNANSVYLGSNKAFQEARGLVETDIVGRTDFDLYDPNTAAEYQRTDQILLDQRMTWRNEGQLVYPDGREVELETLKTPYYDHEGRVIGLIGISRDITERTKREQEIRYLNYHDVLTGLYNRTFFQEELKHLDTSRRLPLTVLIGDINGLKLINDALGHVEGDKMLIATADILRRCCRADDIIARVGGDEFWILMPDTDSQAAQRIIDRILAACQEYAQRIETDFYFTDIALGFATKTTEDESLAQILRQAEDNMYKRKLLDTHSLQSSIISSIKATMFEKSFETEAHAERLTELSNQLGRALGLSDTDLVALELLSTLHDIGKIRVDRNILTKVEPLTESDWVEIKKHPEAGYRITQASPELRHISNYILSHHERWDGKGYPYGLSGRDIPILSRILLVVDAYDAMTQDRGYRPAMSSQDAIAEIERHAGSQFDPVIARAFIDQVIGVARP